MSEVIRRIERRQFCHVIKTADDMYYYVDSVYTFDHGYETMAFIYDKDESRVVDWSPSHAEWYNTAEEMAERHKYICEHFEEVIKDDN